MDRLKILQAISQNKPKLAPLPTLLNIRDGEITDLCRFKENLLQVGGTFFEVCGEKKLNVLLNDRFPHAINFTKKETWDEYSQDCLKEKISDFKTVVLEGQFGVAENGAVWIDDFNFPNRLIPFACENLVIVLNVKHIIGNMHDAYYKMRNNKTGFGVFISGPSKTADIEQNLVYGAQGAKKLIVILIAIDS